MKEITRIHLAKTPYEVEIDAKKSLSKYLDELKNYSGDESILSDVEIRITEILAEHGVLANRIITTKEVEAIKAQLGEPRIFAGEDAENEAKESPQLEKTASEKRLYRNTPHAMIGGVAYGMAEYFNLDPTLARVLWVVSLFPTGGFSFIIYIFMMIIVPPVKNASDVLRMRGEPITAGGIQEVNEEYDFAKDARRRRFWLRLFAAIFGINSALTALGGIALIVIGNYGLATMSDIMRGQNFGADLLTFTVLANLAGVAFVAFFAIVSYLLFTLRANKKLLISLPIIAVIGVISISAFGVMLMDNQANYRQQIKENLKTEAVDFNKADLDKIKTLEANGSLMVEYHAGEQRKIEFVGNKNVSQKANLELKFDGEKLTVDYHAKHWYGAERVRIYGPELTSATGDFVEYHPGVNGKTLERVNNKMMVEAQ